MRGRQQEVPCKGQAHEHQQREEAQHRQAAETGTRDRAEHRRKADGPDEINGGNKARQKREDDAPLH